MASRVIPSGVRARGWRRKKNRAERRESGERAKSSERRRKHASLAGTHVETSSAAGLAGALLGVCFEYGG